jgi:hypothetical protein
MKYLVGFIVVYLLISCVKYEEVRNEDLSTAFIINSSPTFKGYFYEGSDSVFHYFICKWHLKKDKYFKIPTNKFKVLKPYQLNEGRKELKIDLFKEDNEKFGENEFDTIYIFQAK